MQRREWWIVGLERAEGDEIDASDAVPDALVGQEPRQRLHFRHLRHGPIMNIRLSGRARQAGAAARRRRAAGGTPLAAALPPQAMPGARSATARPAADPPRRPGAAAPPVPRATPWTHPDRCQVDRTWTHPQTSRRY